MDAIFKVEGLPEAPEGGKQANLVAADIVNGLMRLGHLCNWEVLPPTDEKREYVIRIVSRQGARQAE